MNSNLDQMLAELSSDGVENLRRAVEIGKWPDGKPVDAEQRGLCMQALIAWEQKNLPEEQRSGYMPSSACASSPKDEPAQVIKGLE
ncbi:MAG: YeaC family protein [Pseudomonadales bacterium]